MRRILSVVCVVGVLLTAVPLTALCASAPSHRHVCRCCQPVKPCCCSKADPGRRVPEPATPQQRGGADRESLVPEPGTLTADASAEALLAPTAQPTFAAQGPPAFLTTGAFRC